MISEFTAVPYHGITFTSRHDACLRVSPASLKIS